MLDRLSKNKRNVGLAVVAGLVLWFAWEIRAVLNPLILGYLLAFILHPAVLHLQRERGWGRPRAVNTIFVLFALLFTLVGLGVWVQGKQLVDRVSVTGNEDVLVTAEAELDRFLERAQGWAESVFGQDEHAVEGQAEGDAGEGGQAASTELKGAGETLDGARAAADESNGEPAPPLASEPTEGIADADEASAAASKEAATDEDWTVRDLARAWWQGYLDENQMGAADVALENAPAALVLIRRLAGSIVSIVTLLTLLPIYTWFLLFELERIHRFVRRYVPKAERERVTRISTQIGEVISNFFRGRLLISVLKGAIISLGLALVGAPYPLIFGMGGGFLSLVPFIGPTLAFAGSLTLTLGLADMPFVLAFVKVGAVFAVAELIEGYVLIPKILGESLGLHPVVVLVSVFAGGAALGMFGFLIAIPLTAALVILGRELVLPALRQFADEDADGDADGDEPGGGDGAEPVLG